LRAERATILHGSGRAADLEATALAAEALATAGRDPARTNRLLAHLTAAKDPSGSWHSTQATVLTLRALLKARGRAVQPRGEVILTLDGRPAARGRLEEATRTQVFNLDHLARPGTHRISLEFRGQGVPDYQIVARAHRPRGAVEPPAAGPSLEVAYPTTDLVRGRQVTARVRLAPAAGRPLAMAVVELGLPPGVDVDEEALGREVRAHRLARFERQVDRLVLYVPGGAAALALDVPMTPRLAMTALAPPSVAYEYYDPDLRAATPPVRLTVRDP
jgi:hypothetical protein